jgi:hypothetical protein
VELTEAERATLLRALFELWVTQSVFDDDPDRNLIPIIATIPSEQIEALVRKLGGVGKRLAKGADKAIPSPFDG